MNDKELKIMLIEIDEINKNIAQLSFDKKDMEYKILNVLCKNNVYQWLKLDVNKMRRELQ